MRHGRAREVVELADGSIVRGGLMRRVRSQDLGGQGVVTQGATLTILRVDFGDAAELCTVCLTRADEPTTGIDAASDYNAPLLAEIQFGAGASGTIERARVDWLNGVLLTIPAANISVDCVYPTEAGAAAARYRVGAMVMPGVRPGAMGSFAQARLTSRLGDVLTGSSVATLVPPRATSFRVYGDDPAASGSVRALLALDIKGVNYEAEIGPTFGEECPVLSNTRAVMLENVSGGTVRLSILWSIAL